MDTTKFQEVIDQVVHQAMINLSDGLSNTIHSVVRNTIASNLSYQYNHHASQPIIFQHQTSAQIDGYQYYASANPADTFVYYTLAFKYYFVVYCIGKACRYAYLRDNRNSSRYTLEFNVYSVSLSINRSD